jgi:hypothetical protein
MRAFRHFAQKANIGDVQYKPYPNSRKKIVPSHYQQSRRSIKSLPGSDTPDNKFSNPA